MSKPKVITVYSKLKEAIKSQIKLNYPHGFEKYLITFPNAKKKLVSALPFETEDRYYLIRMTAEEAKKVIKADDDYDADGHLIAGSVKKLEKKAAK